MSDEFIIVAIDGGAASGKSTTARTLAEKLNLMHVDTGSIYRVICHALLEKGVEGFDEKVGEHLDALVLETEVSKRQGRMRLDGKILDHEQLRSDRVNANVSRYAAQPLVRNKLLEYQRSQAEVARREGFYGLVMEGRDIGSVIFPDAEVKIFLQAEERERERRRAAEGQADSIRKRDEMDSTRKTAPLACPADAVVIDTGKHDVEEVVAMVTDLVERARA